MAHLGKGDVGTGIVDGSPRCEVGVAGQTPLLELVPGGGEVVITRFECRTWRSLLTVLLLHLRVKPQVKKVAPGFRGSSVLVNWRDKTVLSVSLWESAKSIYSMGQVSRHILATRVPGHTGVATTSGVYSYVGDWRRVLFRSRLESPPPLSPIKDLGVKQSARRTRTEEMRNDDSD